MQSLQLKDQQKQRELLNILNEIDQNILDDEEDIIYELENCMKGLNDDDKSSAVKHIKAKYLNIPFVAKLSFISSCKEKESFKQQYSYRDLRQQNQIEQIIQQLRNPYFCKENNIPIIMEQNTLIIQKLGCQKFQDILDIWDCQNDQQNLTMLQYTSNSFFFQSFVAALFLMIKQYFVSEYQEIN